MPKRPAAQPRAAAPLAVSSVKPPAAPLIEAPLPDLEFTVTPVPAAAVSVAPALSASQPTLRPMPAATVDDELDFTISQFERDFSDSSVMAINVDHDVDPAQSEVERVVLLFANRQDAAARSVLETLVRQYAGADAQRFWTLLFDLLQLSGDRQAFEQFGLDYARACETSPPAWREAAGASPAKASAAGVFAVQGVLTADNLSLLDKLAEQLALGAPVRLDCSRLVGCDDAVAGQLADLLRRARQAGAPVAVDGVERFLDRLNERLPTGEARNEAAWLLLLELLQRAAAQDAFEERAVDYAITFERSPPSWEGGRPASRGLPELKAPLDEAYYLQGELRDQRFAELNTYLARAESPVLDFSAVHRLDFYSASQLANCLAPLKAVGREPVIRSPHPLIAELMAMVGLHKIARIVIPKS